MLDFLAFVVADRVPALAYHILFNSVGQLWTDSSLQPMMAEGRRD